MASNDLDLLVQLNDPRIERLIRAESDDERDGETVRLLLDLAQPLCRRIISRYAGSGSLLHEDEVQDLEATVMLRLVAKLRSMPETEAIRCLEDYVAKLTYNAVNDAVRKHTPEYTRLKDRLRHTVAKEARLTTWRTQNGILVCGTVAMSGCGPRDVAFEMTKATTAMFDRERPGDALHAILAAVGAPVSFAWLCRTVAALWSVGEAEAPTLSDDLVGVTSSDVHRFEALDALRALWREIRALRPLQRKALLLNLRYPGSTDLLSLVVATGLTTFEELAAEVEMTTEDLEALWDSLPLDDLRIATMMGLTRQQVINLRKSARSRLLRRFR